MIIHISGPSGSGKTYLGNKLKNKFGNKDDKVIPNIEFKMRQNGYVGWSFMLFNS
jgi:uridine kinase